jgi:hypothetical protein
MLVYGEVCGLETLISLWLVVKCWHSSTHGPLQPGGCVGGWGWG